MWHLDLFSGIGGFALAADRVFGNVEHTFCDNEPFSQAVLKKHWPEAYIYSDIRSLTADTERERYFHRQSEKLSAEPVLKAQREPLADIPAPFILTGGFPCQPFSQAGRRRGEEDDRFLWPEMLRVIREFSPLWVIAENVRGLLTQGGGVVFERVCADLEAAGYEVQPIVIPAVAVGAPHRRDRIWFIAHTQHEPERHAQRGGADQRPSARIARPNKEWCTDWHEVAARLCRVDDGLPRRLDRSHRLKALGNAIVPQVAEQIMRAISNTDRT